MRAEPVFVGAPEGAGMYESFYLRAVSAREPVGVWIRHTVRKPPGRAATGSVWCTVFDASRGAPFMHKSSFEELQVPPGGWIDIGGRARIGPEGAEGECGPARWSLRFAAEAPELRHLRPRLLYRTPLPRTKLTSPAPLARFDGVLELAGREPIELAGWRGMVGHNWGSEHAARWIWLHGCDFAGAPGAWLDVALGRVRVGSRLTPWVASGSVWAEGREHRLGGLGAGAARRPRVRGGRRGRARRPRAVSPHGPGRGAARERCGLALRGPRRRYPHGGTPWRGGKRAQRRQLLGRRSRADARPPRRGRAGGAAQRPRRRVRARHRGRAATARRRVRALRRRLTSDRGSSKRTTATHVFAPPGRCSATSQGDSTWMISF